jgi:hypothetical protein
VASVQIDKLLNRIIVEENQPEKNGDTICRCPHGRALITADVSVARQILLYIWRLDHGQEERAAAMAGVLGSWIDPWLEKKAGRSLSVAPQI